jgi:hypothetical protein|tara:strand:+ start:102 stop:344 length:243 start_codon:yes stop_codon:yes gene_type:complete
MIENPSQNKWARIGFVSELIFLAANLSEFFAHQICILDLYDPSWGSLNFWLGIVSTASGIASIMFLGGILENSGIEISHL